VTSASAAIVDSVTWPDLRSLRSIAVNCQVPRPLAQRLDGSTSYVPTPPPNVELESQRVGTFPFYTELGRPTTVDVEDRPMSAPVTKPKDIAPLIVVEDRLQSAPEPWKAAITAHVNALWNAFHNKSQVAVSTLDTTDRDNDSETCAQKEKSSSTRQYVSAFPVSFDYPGVDRLTQQSTRRLWRLDSDVEVDLGRMSRRMPSPELDLSVHPRTVRVREDTNATHTLAPSQNPIMTDRVSRDPNLDGRNDKASKKRAVSTETDPRQTVKRDDGERKYTSRYRRGRSASDDLRCERRRGGHNRSSQSPRPTRRNETRSRDNARRTTRDGSSDSSESLPCTQNRPRRTHPQISRDRSPTGDDDGDNSDSDDRDSDRRRRRSRRRPRRRREPYSDDDTPDDGDDGDGPSVGSSSESDGLGPTARGHKKFRIKPQKFDGTGSWESWWAHFQNCATYNRWTERDKLAFLKGVRHRSYGIRTGPLRIP